MTKPRKIGREEDREEKRICKNTLMTYLKKKLYQQMCCVQPGQILFGLKKCKKCIY